MRFPSLVAGAVVASGLSFAVPAAAAPQVLGVVASITPVPLACKGETCTAQLSAFCLQRERDVPLERTAYRAADPKAFTLIATRGDGTSIRLPADDQVAFASAFGYASVRITVPSELLGGVDAVTLAVEVAPGAAVVPVPVAGDPEPLGDDEIALATGPLRELASRHFDEPSTARDAAQVVEAMVNGLPRRFWEGPKDQSTLWNRQVTAELQAAATPEAVAVARGIFEH
ncbi:MAG: hypothetical protein ACREIB_11000, partial [Pseudomonadota bacterium]